MFEIKRCEFDLIQKHMQSNQNMNGKHTVHIVRYCCYDAIVITQNIYF